MVSGGWTPLNGVSQERKLPAVKLQSKASDDKNNNVRFNLKFREVSNVAAVSTDD